MLECLECKNKLEEDQLLEVFYSGCKKTSKLGLEYERLAVYKNTKKAASYEDISLILENFTKLGWEKVIENGELLGLISDIGHITLEPGSQFELSLNPIESIQEIENTVEKYQQQMETAISDLPVEWLNSGIQPVSTFDNITVIPKQRYRWMSEYLPTKGSLPFVMMRETAGIQVSLDYKDEFDAVEKLSLALKLSPIVSAIYANSPIREGKLNGYKSFRARSWLDTDNDRCGLVSEKLFELTPDFCFKSYAQILLDIPMIFIDKNGSSIPVNNLTFRQFMKEGYNGLCATIDDWNNHLSLYFPDVRLKSYIEIRNQDSQKMELIPSIPALWKGIMYNKDAMSAVNDILKPFNYFDFQDLRRNTPKYGIDYEIKNYNVQDLAKEILNVAYQSLKNNDIGEESHLEPIMKLVQNNLTPADITIKNWTNKL